MEYKFSAPMAGVSVSDGQVIEGYASVFDQRDRSGDMVLRGAYRTSLQQLHARGDRVRMLWQHDPAQPIGIWDEVTEDAHGLRVRGRLLPDVARAREAQALLAAGAVDGLSIGYRTIRAEGVKGARILSELDLWEVSLVTFPMQLSARLDVKADDLSPLLALTARLRTSRVALSRAGVAPPP